MVQEGLGAKGRDQDSLIQVVSIEGARALQVVKVSNFYHYILWRTGQVVSLATL